MRFSFFAVLSGLAALAVVNALPVDNSRSIALSEETTNDSQPPIPQACAPVSLTFYANK